MTSSAPSAASDGNRADALSCWRTHTSAFDRVRLYTVTLCPAFARCPAMGAPIAPSPMNATRAIERVLLATGQVCVAELDEPLSAEARLVAAVYDPHRQLAQEAHRADVIGDVAAVQLVEERPVVDGVAGEQHAGRRLPQTDAS